ncbi:PREDICTED: coiled-coil domain-containing protein 170-like [Galeopterus variegatus]|uniref:Coiled-coil domain-containing protein 170-like n=1 Tax=Galeopterus variegatus TaxID=482537 RepID=A0ABM0Q7Y9_GALVR|nr:PREDICTED: coiled-coil domain-containing protein 170-like [Galeopterus variegatus]
MLGPFQFLNHTDPGRLATSQTKGPHEAKPSEVRHLSAHRSRKSNQVACFDPPLEVVPTRNLIMYNRKAADPVHPELAGLLVKNKNLLAELRNLHNKLFIKETSLQEMKTELQSYKENNLQQSFQIKSLKDNIKDLQELIASLTRIKSLKNTNIQSLEKGNCDLTEQIIELENHLRVHLVEREKAEQKADLLEKKLSGARRFTSFMNMKGQEDSLDIFMMKEAVQHGELEDFLMYGEKVQGESGGLRDTEEKVRGNKTENSRTKNSQIDEHSKKFKELEKDNTQQILLNIWQNLQIATTPRLEEKIRKLQKQLSDLKLSNKNMKTQLTRVNALKDKTIEKLRQSLRKMETMKEKAVMKTDNLKTTLDCAEQEARSGKERAHEMLDPITPKLSTAKRTLEEVSGQEQELIDFRETILKILGFNMKTADKEIINQPRILAAMEYGLDFCVLNVGFQVAPSTLAETFFWSDKGACCPRQTGAGSTSTKHILSVAPFLSCKAPVFRSGRLRSVSSHTATLLRALACSPTHLNRQYGCLRGDHLPVKDSVSEFPLWTQRNFLRSSS